MHPAGLIAVLREGLARVERHLEPVADVPAVRAERDAIALLVADLIVGLETGQIGTAAFEELALRVDPVADELPDPWVQAIVAATAGLDLVRMSEVLAACGVGAERAQRRHAVRAGRILRRQGFAPCTLPRDASGHRERAWRRF